MPLSYFKPSLFYIFCRYVGCFALRYFFYRKVYVFYKKPLSKSIPVIFISNHQNAFMDAFLIICTSKRHYPIFFARSDEFRIPILRHLLKTLRVAPLYRINQGLRNVLNNFESFNLAVNFLNSNRSIALFPEGTHYNKLHIHNLKKGIARLILYSLSQQNIKTKFSIIPICISYTDYTKSRQDIFICYGNPIDFNGFDVIFNQNHAHAIKILTNIIQEHLKSHCIHISDLHNYDLLEQLIRCYCTARTTKGKDFYLLFKHTADALHWFMNFAPSDYNILLNKARNITQSLLNYGIKYQIFKQNQYNKRFWLSNLILLLFITPLQLLRSVIIFLPFTIIYKIFKAILKDQQFISSMTFSTAFFISPLITLLQSILLLKFTDNIYIALANVAIAIMVPIYDWWHNAYNNIKTIIQRKKINYKTIKEFEELFVTLDKILNNYKKAKY